MPERIHPLWRCPRCGGALAPGPEELGCTGCGRVITSVHGAPLLGEGAYRFPVDGIDARAEPAALAARAAAELVAGTEAALGAGVRAWLRHPGRADGVLWALPRLSQSVVLDAGCGWGGLTFPLARWVREVHALDPTPAAVAYVAARARAESVPGVVAAGGELGALPYADAAFDGVVLNGVLEWVPVSYPDVPAEVAVRRALAEVARVLRPGGRLYLAIENRFGLRYVLGARDEHTGLRWVNVLPRPLASAYHRLARRGPHRARTHSLGALERRLRGVGLQVVERCGPLRDYRSFRFLVPLDDRRGLALLGAHGMPFPSLEGRVFAAVARLAGALPQAVAGPLAVMLAPSLVVVAERPR